jgi:phosphatidylinositol kinase/protein kinase (PI-3  family)
MLYCRYHPEDWKADVCKNTMGKKGAECQKFMDSKRMTEAEAKTKRVSVFKEICRKFKPVFRHFFYENFSSPGIYRVSGCPVNIRTFTRFSNT